ncbi:glycosyltransferase [Megamonas funiformis]
MAFGIDANFTIGTGVLIYRILQHNDDNMVFHIFTDSFYDEDISR